MKSRNPFRIFHIFILYNIHTFVIFASFLYIIFNYIFLVVLLWILEFKFIAMVIFHFAVLCRIRVFIEEKIHIVSYWQCDFWSK